MKSATFKGFVFLAPLLLIQLVSCQRASHRALPQLDVCGRTKASRVDTQIIGGAPAVLGVYPWLVVVGYTSAPGQKVQWMCGGSIISSQWVVTAAHCLHPDILPKKNGSPYEPKVIRAGELDLDENVEDGATPQDYDVEKVIFHPEYNPEKKINDIGLIKTKQVIEFSEAVGGVAPICLPSFEIDTNDFLGFRPYVAGFGRTSTARGASRNTRLMETQVEIHDLTSCRENLTSAPSTQSAIIDHRVICAASPGKDSCQGDSGGPLMMYRTRNGVENAFLMGVVSYGLGCAKPGYPGVYTKVSKYMVWIMENMR